MGDSPPYKRCLRYRAATSTTSSDPHLEQLIEEVKKYPCLYNSNSLQYRDQYRKEECWDTISRVMHCSRGDLKKEWKRLRDGYRQALVTRLSGKKDSKKKVLKPWKYEEQMDFLKPYICPRSRLLVAARSLSSDNEFDYFPIKEEVITDDDSSQQSASEQPSIISEVLIRSTLRNIKSDPDASYKSTVGGKKRKKTKGCFMPRKRAASACASRPENNGGEGTSINAGNGDTPSVGNNHNGNMPSTSNSGNNGFSPGGTSTQPIAGCSNNNDTGNSNNNHDDGGNTSSVIGLDMIDIVMPETISNRNIIPIDKVIEPSSNNPNGNGTVPSTCNNCSTLSISNVGNNDSSSSASNADNNDRMSPASSYENHGTPLTSDGENDDPTPSSPRNNISVPSTGNAGNNSSTPLDRNGGDTPSNSNAGNSGIRSANNNNGSTSSLSNNGMAETTRRNGIPLLLNNARNNNSTQSTSNTSSLNNNRCSPSSSNGGNNAVTTSSNRAGNRGFAPFSRNIGYYALGRAAISNQSSDNAYVVFVDDAPTNPENHENIDEMQSCRTYHIQEFNTDSILNNNRGNNPCNRVTTMRDATPSNLRSNDQVYRAMQPTAGALDFSVRNNDQQLSPIQLFLASIYQTIKQMPLKYQNNVKINLLEYLKVAEEEFNHLKAQRANNGTSNAPRQSQSNQDNRGTLQSATRFLGDNDPRHGALQLFLASIHESLKKMPTYLLSYMKINMLELVNNVEEIYKNAD